MGVDGDIEDTFYSFQPTSNAAFNLSQTSKKG